MPQARYKIQKNKIEVINETIYEMKKILPRQRPPPRGRNRNDLK